MRIWWITDGCVMNVTMRITPWQTGHARRFRTHERASRVAVFNTQTIAPAIPESFAASRGALSRPTDGHVR